MSRGTGVLGEILKEIRTQNNETEEMPISEKGELAKAG